MLPNWYEVKPIVFKDHIKIVKQEEKKKLTSQKSNKNLSQLTIF